jgi:putative protease
MKADIQTLPVPSILAPAGNKESFLAALSAEADAIYCGLKRYSARMEAQNFSFEELATLTQLAHDKGKKVLITINTMLTPSDLDEMGDVLKRLKRFVRPDALIIQDLALLQLARQTDFSGELVLSTLANVSFPEALNLVRKTLGVNGIVIPRELDIDEIKTMATNCPKDLKLEIFVHGALCYGVSGRCYWSSFLGGKSGLRGRCVQPCRRYYRQNDHLSRSFSCLDLSLDVLVKILMNIPQIQNWKIEGRKKGPHYVFYTVKAYQLLRDHRNDPKAKKQALMLLERSLGRKGTHYHFLPQRPQNPISKDGQTGSGLPMGKTQRGGKTVYLRPKTDLLPGDVLRVGYDDEKWHFMCKVKRYVPKKGRFHLNFATGRIPPAGTPVFLIDRRENTLRESVQRLESELNKSHLLPRIHGAFQAKLPVRASKRKLVKELHVFRTSQAANANNRIGLWLSAEGLSIGAVARIWWWLPPVIWPNEEKKTIALIDGILKKGAQYFVLNAPWQIALFKNSRRITLWAGPFCNISNSLAVSELAAVGFSGVIVSPELGRKDYLMLPKHSPLPLGVIITGNWPLCVARALPGKLKTHAPFTSPKGEQGWVSTYSTNIWVYPNWIIDLKQNKETLKSAGYSLFVNLKEPVPRKIKMKKRPGLWNWKLGLK